MKIIFVMFGTVSVLKRNLKFLHRDLPTNPYPQRNIFSNQEFLNIIIMDTWSYGLMVLWSYGLLLLFLVFLVVFRLTLMAYCFEISHVHCERKGKCCINAIRESLFTFRFSLQCCAAQLQPRMPVKDSSLANATVWPSQAIRDE